LKAGYGKKQVLNVVSLDTGRVKIMALIGRNGAEKSTLLKAVISDERQFAATQKDWRLKSIIPFFVHCAI
jgi:ABC-type branched-subunit amino acid transport system ATPase component